MQKAILLLTILGCTFCSSAQSFNSKEKLQQALNGISAHEKRVEIDNTLMVIHPLLKKEDREIKREFEGEVSWNGDNPEIKYIRAEQVSGAEAKQSVELGRKYPFTNSVARLKTMFSENTFINWKAADDIELYDKIYSG